MSTTIGEKIRDLRKIEKLSQQQLADIIGVTKGTIYTWENGKNEPTTKALRKLTEHDRFKQYAAWLVTDDETVQEAPVHYLAEKFEKLPTAVQDQVLDYMDYLLAKQKKEKK